MDDSVRTAVRAHAAGVAVVIEIWEAMGTSSRIYRFRRPTPPSNISLNGFSRAHDHRGIGIALDDPRHGIYAARSAAIASCRVP
jgi:hypothetical protein